LLVKDTHKNSSSSFSCFNTFPLNICCYR
jgi:hypothetical protein